MKRNQFIKILVKSTVALLIPVLGQMFVNGWNWGLGDFVFAWVFFNLLGITYTFVQNRINNRAWKILVGLIVIGIFAFVWIRLATG